MADSSKRGWKQILIFTDLDGTLLDQQTYDFDPALPALRLIHSLRIPLILVSSKTRAEIESIRRRLSLDSPFIVENGGGIFFPPTFRFPKDHPCERINGYNTIVVGRPIEEVLEKIRMLKGRFRFKGFSEMPPEEIASLTGLNLDQASLASRREFDEPIVLENPLDDGEAFCEEASDIGVDCIHGGRFMHLFLGGSKGRAVGIVLDIYRQLKGPIFSIALGDSANDISMLEAVDKAVLMRGKDGGPLRGLADSDLIEAEGSGPRVWNKVMLSILGDFS